MIDKDGEALERLTEALDHVERIASGSSTQTSRIRWIAQRCRSALLNDDEWRTFKTPPDKMLRIINERDRFKLEAGKLRDQLRWRSVDDEAPAIDTHVLLADPDNARIYDMVWDDGDGGRFSGTRWLPYPEDKTPESE